MNDTEETIAALRAKLIPEPVSDYSHELTARNAANVELGEMIFNAQRKINELRENLAKGAVTKTDLSVRVVSAHSQQPER